MLWRQLDFYRIGLCPSNHAERGVRCDKMCPYPAYQEAAGVVVLRRRQSITQQIIDAHGVLSETLIVFKIAGRVRPNRNGHMSIAAVHAVMKRRGPGKVIVHHIACHVLPRPCSQALELLVDFRPETENSYKLDELLRRTRVND